MERDSFIFYKSFYEAIRDLPDNIRLEVFTAITEYALYGKQPENLKPFARGMFTLIKPNIDTNTARYVNGTKGGRRKKKAAPADPDYSMTYEQEVDAMRSDEGWRQVMCNDFNITVDEYDSRLYRFLARCKEDSKKKGKVGHDSAEDAKSHLRYWMSKAFPQTQSYSTPPIQSDDELPPPPDYSYNGGFGGVDID